MVRFLSGVWVGAVVAVASCFKGDVRAAAAAGATVSSSIVFVVGLFLLG